ncbi:acyltransferase [Dyella sp. GSA-30]|uniref:acyltransferase family protein n=1 Tax=Dyella sp. GSA-30 TaxID=2994496 RepID=UPI0024929575|nr:acyltransferase [Dyella sp. GSA-30]BDU18961.1 acyltransferase [Dyella sp. GSA-30]
MSYRNIQGMRAIAALLVISCHSFQNLEPMRAHWARPFFLSLGPMGVDIFFVISGFIIYQVMQRSIASMDTAGRGRVVYAFAMKRIIRIYPLYWFVFGASCLWVAWAAPMTPPPERLPLLLALVGNLPNYRVPVAWTLTFEVYFYAVAAVSLLLFARRAMVGLAIWFAIVGTAALLDLWSPWGKPLDFVFAPIVLEFLLGVAVAILVERGGHRFHAALLVGAVIWLSIGTWFMRPSEFALRVEHWGVQVAISRTYGLHVICWGIPAAVLIYEIIALEIAQRWIMPRMLQYLGNASFSIYLWHFAVFTAVAEIFARLGWVGVVSSTWLTAAMIAIALGIALLSYHFLEKPSLRLFGQWFLGRGVSSHSLETEAMRGSALYKS